MTISTEVWERLEAKMRFVAEDYPLANLVLAREGAEMAAWSLAFCKDPQGQGEIPLDDNGPDPSQPTVAICLPQDVYDLVGAGDLQIMGERYAEIRDRAIDMTQEESSCFLVCARTSLGLAMDAQRGEVWMRAAAVPLAAGLKPRPFTLERDASGNYWISVPPRWLVAEPDRFLKWMDEIAAQVAADRAQSATGTQPS